MPVPFKKVKITDKYNNNINELIEILKLTEQFLERSRKLRKAAIYDDGDFHYQMINAVSSCINILNEIKMSEEQ